MHLLLFLLSGWLIFGHIIISELSNISLLGSLFTLCFSLTKGHARNQPFIFRLLSLHCLRSTLRLFEYVYFYNLL